jgi:glycosyltransferase involved in cell wall biosynthesis
VSKKNENPLVSIITVCYNSEEYIRDTIESVLNQTYDNIEYIIVDGDSTDNTLDIIKEYEPKFNGRMRWISEPDDGIYDAMNKGIEMSNGKIIGIINSDDWYELNAVDEIVNIFIYRNVDMVYGEIDFWNNGKIVLEKGANKNLDKLDKGMIINHPTVFLKKYIYDKFGKFKNKYSIAADWELMLRLRNNIKIIAIDKKVANFRLGGISYNLTKKIAKEKHLIRSRHNLYENLDLYYLIDLFKIIFLSQNLILYINKIKLNLKNMFKSIISGG